MLWNASTLIGFAVDATDGRLGTVRDLLFDDRSWTVPWLAVDAGAEEMVLPVDTAAKPNVADSLLPLRLTLEGAKNAHTGADGETFTAGDPHLWSLAELVGFAMNATDGPIGHAEDILLRHDDWKIRFLTVATESDEKVMISRKAITHIDRATKIIHLDLHRQAVKDSPAYDETISVDGADDEPFLSYFGIKFVKKAQT